MPSVITSVCGAVAIEPARTTMDLFKISCKKSSLVSRARQLLRYRTALLSNCTESVCSIRPKLPGTRGFLVNQGSDYTGSDIVVTGF
jgi:hypothetical protein